MYPNAYYQRDVIDGGLGPAGTQTTNFLPFRSTLSPVAQGGTFTGPFGAYFSYVTVAAKSDQPFGITVQGGNLGDVTDPDIYTFFDDQTLAAGNQLIKLPVFAPWMRCTITNRGAVANNFTLWRTFTMS